MEVNTSAERAHMLVQCDSIREQVSGIGAHVRDIQDKTDQITEENKQLATEIAEQREELELLRLRLTAGEPTKEDAPNEHPEI